MDLEAAAISVDESDLFSPKCSVCQDDILDPTDLYQVNECWYHKARCFGAKQWFERFAGRNYMGEVLASYAAEYPRSYQYMLHDLLSVCYMVAQRENDDNGTKRGKVERTLAMSCIDTMRKTLMAR